MSQTNKPLFQPIYEEFDFKHFLMANEWIAQQIQSLITTVSPTETIQTKKSLTLIHGPKGSGKTHILKALVDLVSSKSLHALYLPIQPNSIASIHLDALTGELGMGLDLLCLDDLESLSSRQDQLNLYQILNQSENHLVLATETHPLDLNWMNDLKTRMLSGAEIRLINLSESQIKTAVELKCQSIGINLSEAVIESFLKKSDRNMHQITKNLGELLVFAKGKKISFQTINQFFELKP